MGDSNKAHDLFVILCAESATTSYTRDVLAFEQKHGTQLELLLRFMDRALAIGVIATA